MKKLIFLFICLAIFASACSSNDPDPAKIEFLYVSSLTDTSKALYRTTTVDADLEKLTSDNFDLGEVPNTNNYYFIVKNTGEVPATNVTLSIITELEGLSLNVTEFEEIPPFHELDYEEILQNYLLRLTIVHGLSPAGGGSIVPLQPIGNQTILLSATSNDAETTSSVNFKILVADIKAYDEHGEIDLYNPHGATLTGGFEAETFVPDFPAGLQAKVVNSGNVDLPIEVFNTISWKQEHLLKPGEALEVLGDRTVTIAVKEASAIRDFVKLPIIANNKCYFALDRR